MYSEASVAPIRAWYTMSTEKWTYFSLRFHVEHIAKEIAAAEMITSPINLSLISLVSSLASIISASNWSFSSYLSASAIIMMPPKQIMMPIISIALHFSWRSMQAKSEIQNGLVWKIIVEVLIGMYVIEILYRTKVNWPAKERTIMSNARFLGNLKGFCLIKMTHTTATSPIDMFLNSENSMILTPSFAKYLNITN